MRKYKLTDTTEMAQTASKNRKEEFLSKLKDLLDEYDATIEFTCDESSDTYGLYGDHLEIIMREDGFRNKVVFKSDGWEITPKDIR